MRQQQSGDEHDSRVFSARARPDAVGKHGPGAFEINQTKGKSQRKTLCSRLTSSDFLVLNQAAERIYTIRCTDASLSRFLVIAVTDKSAWAVCFTRNVDLFGNNNSVDTASAAFEQVSFQRIAHADIWPLWCGYNQKCKLDPRYYLSKDSAVLRSTLCCISPKPWLCRSKLIGKSTHNLYAVQLPALVSSQDGQGRSSAHIGVSDTATFDLAIKVIHSDKDFKRESTIAAAVRAEYNKLRGKRDTHHVLAVHSVRSAAAGTSSAVKEVQKALALKDADELLDDSAVKEEGEKEDEETGVEEEEAGEIEQAEEDDGGQEDGGDDNDEEDEGDEEDEEDEEDENGEEDEGAECDEEEGVEVNMNAAEVNSRAVVKSMHQDVQRLHSSDECPTLYRKQVCDGSGCTWRTTADSAYRRVHGGAVIMKVGQPCELEVSNLKSWLKGVRRTLQAIHKAGYLHTDIRPSNALAFGRDIQLIDHDHCVSKEKPKVVLARGERYNMRGVSLWGTKLNSRVTWTEAHDVEMMMSSVLCLLEQKQLCA